MSQCFGLKLNEQNWNVVVWLQEAVPLPDQIDEAVKYIESLEMKLKKSKEKKETLSGRKRSHSCTSEFKSPQLEIHEMGSTLDVVLITGEDDKFIFHEIIRLIHEEGAEVLNANFSVFGNSIFHAIHAKVRTQQIFIYCLWKWCVCNHYF